MLFFTHDLLIGLFLIWYIIFDTANASGFQGNLPNLSLISSLFNMFIKPYFKTWHFEPTSRAFEVERTVERVVRQKVKQLQPFLQDNDTDGEESDNEIRFEGNDETTILEFVPQMGKNIKTSLRNGNDTFRANMRRYKNVRSKIYEALEAELVSDKTKTLVMRTMDELLSKMVETQCRWKGGVENKLDTNSRFIIPRTIVNMWRTEWQKFKTKFSTLGQPRAQKQGNSLNILMSYLTKLNSIINDVSVNLDTFAKKYKVNCNVTERKDAIQTKPANQKTESVRLSYVSDNENVCKNFKVCSKELKTFFIDFYKSVNDTAVNVIRSYAEMFTRDVNTDVSNEKNSIVDLIFKIADQIEQDIIKIFINHTNEFHLHEHKANEANVNLLLGYVKNVVKHIKEAVREHLLVKLNHLHKKVSSSIQQDVEVNLGVDLGNLERDLISKICLIFNICNGHRKNRRFGIDEDEKESPTDNENKVHVKVELTINEELNDILKDNSNVPTTRSVSSTRKVLDEVIKTRHFTETTILNFAKYANISVTRTTLIWQA